HLKMYAIFIALIALVMSASTTTYAADDSDAINEKLGVPIIVYGDTLTDAQREEVRDLLDVEKLEAYEEYDITGADIANYIDGDPNSRMFSSAKITRKDKGHGIVVNIVTADNI